MTCFRVLLSLLAAILLYPTAALAQSNPVVRIENRWQTDQAINIEKGAIESTPAGPGWNSAMWELVPSERAFDNVQKSLRMRKLRNVWTKEYLTFGAAFGAALFKMNKQDQWADWYLDPVPGYPGYFRIQSAISEGNYLHVEHGKLEVGPIQFNWQSAVWKIAGYSPVDYATPHIVENQTQLAAARTQQTLLAAQQQRQADQAQANARQAAIDFKNSADNPCNTYTGGKGLSTVLGSDGGNTAGCNTATPNAPTRAASDYDAAIDYCHSSLSSTDTANTITVEFWGADGLAGTKTAAGSGGCSVFGAAVSADLHFKLNTYLDVNRVKVSTDGSDGFFIDQVQVYRDSTKIIWSGRDGGGGWCLSTDPNDAKGGWESAASTCSASITFP